MKPRRTLKLNRMKKDPAVQAYFRELGRIAGSAGTGRSKKRGGKKYYQQIAEASWKKRRGYDWAAHARRGWVTRRRNKLKREAEAGIVS